jgi:hypothetical protein
LGHGASRRPGDLDDLGHFCHAFPEQDPTDRRLGGIRLVGKGTLAQVRGAHGFANERPDVLCVRQGPHLPFALSKLLKLRESLTPVLIQHGWIPGFRARVSRGIDDLTTLSASWTVAPGRA